MQNLMRVFLLPAAASIILFISAIPASMQKTVSGKPEETKTEGSIKVTLIAASSEFEIRKSFPVSVIVRVDNQTDKKVRLGHTPIFNLERIGISESDKKKLIWGDYYIGRIVFTNSTTSKKQFLEKGEHLDLAADITDLEWKDSKSSYDYWRKMFDFMEKGEYFLNAQVFIDFSESEKEDIKDFSSDNIKISYK